ncbi:hypothetical protein EV424DRAFT_1360769 [Suillus variegatus]|nr:hypothetical protein EV424DRAFT_1360769 [Suillus variegatus]
MQKLNICLFIIWVSYQCQIMWAKTLVQLPPELSYLTLSFLDSYDLLVVRVREVSEQMYPSHCAHCSPLLSSKLTRWDPRKWMCRSAIRRKRLRLYDAASLF